jgi:iron(III) transport system permease protein
MVLKSGPNSRAAGAPFLDPLLGWRVLLVVILAVVLGAPLASPLVTAASDFAARETWSERGRLAVLLGNTVLLLGGMLAIAMPAGILGAVILYRTDLPARKTLRFVNLLGMFTPLPLFASAWQAALGTGGWIIGLGGVLWEPFAARPDWAPWPTGMPSAICVHALAAIPWVVWIVGHGLVWVERDLEEDALTSAAPWRVFWRVTLPRCQVFLWVAACWILMQGATEITITDVMQVPTFAEEVYTQLAAGDETALARSVCAAVPTIGFSWALLVITAALVRSEFYRQETLVPAPLLFRFRWLSGPWSSVVPVLIVFLAGVPVVGLFWKAGLSGRPEEWSAAVAGNQLAAVARLRWPLLVGSTGAALGAGTLACVLSVAIAWLAARCRWLLILVVAIAALAWAEPAPLVGLGLKNVILHVINWPVASFLRPILYDGPSLVPVVWAHAIRFLPFALVLVWPAMARIPGELRESARIEGASALQELRTILVPLAFPQIVQAGLAVAVLALGEIGAAKLAATPGAPTFALEIFYQMHYGLGSDLAALCILLLALVIVGGALLAFAAGFVTSARSVP